MSWPRDDHDDGRPRAPTPMQREQKCNYEHSLVGFCNKCGWTQDAKQFNEEMRLLRIKAARLEWELQDAKKDLETRNKQLTEARIEGLRIEEKLRFAEQRLALHEEKP